MAWDRVTGVAQVARVHAPRTSTDSSATLPATPAGAGNAPTAPTLRLQIGALLDGEWLAHSADGQQFRLPAASLAGHTFTPGQILLVRVLGTSPQLELALLGSADDAAAATRPPSTLFDLAALQTDQAGMRRLVGTTVNAPTLAAQWRQMVLAHLQQASTVAESAGAPRLAGPAAQGVENRAVLVVPAVPTLVFQTTAWPGVGLRFWLVQRRSSEELPPRRARPTGLRLCLYLNVPGLGAVGVEVDLYDRAVALALTALEALAVPALRSRITLVAARLARANLRLARCQIAQGAVQVPAPAATAAAKHLAEPDAALPPALFRAAAEVVAALSPPFQ